MSRQDVESDVTTWGFIGSGNIGSTVARLAVAAGHDVVLSNSRGPGTSGGPRGRARTARPRGDDAGGRHGRRRRCRDDPAAQLPRRPGRRAAREGRHRHDELLPRLATAGSPSSTTRPRPRPSCSRRTCPSRTSSRRSTTSTTPTSPRWRVRPGAWTAAPWPSLGTTRRPRARFARCSMRSATTPSTWVRWPRVGGPSGTPQPTELPMPPTPRTGQRAPVRPPPTRLRRPPRTPSATGTCRSPVARWRSA